jgi:hypothetical protein
MKDNAFPTHQSINGSPVIDGGLTKREYFAAIALQGLISGYTDEDKCNGYYIPFTDHAELSRNAVDFADTLIKALES